LRQPKSAKKYTPSELRQYTIQTIVKHYTDNDKDEWIVKKLAFNPQLHDKFMTKGGDEILDVLPKASELQKALSSSSYYPSDYEVEILAERTKVNENIIGRVMKRNNEKDDQVGKAKTPDGVWCLGKHDKPVGILLLRHDFVMNQNLDKYTLIVKNRNQYVFDDDDFTQEAREYFLDKKCAKFQVVKDKDKPEKKNKDKEKGKKPKIRIIA